MIIECYAPRKLFIADDRIDQLIESHVKDKAGKVSLSDPVADRDLVLQAIKAGLIEPEDVGGDWAACHWVELEYYHSSVPHAERHRPVWRSSVEKRDV